MRSLRNGTYEDTIEIRRRFKLNDAHVRRRNSARSTRGTCTSPRSERRRQPRRPHCVAGVRGLELGNVALRRAGPNSLVSQNIFVPETFSRELLVAPAPTTRASEPPTDRQAGLLPSQGSERDCAVGALKARTQPGAQPVAVAVLAGRKAELGERRGEAEALRFCRKSFLGAVRCSRRFHLRSKSRSRSSGY
jgi:hypothetical protein